MYGALQMFLESSSKNDGDQLGLHVESFLNMQVNEVVGLSV